MNCTYSQANAGDDGKLGVTFTFSRENNETVANLLGDAFVGGSVVYASKVPQTIVDLL